MTVMMKCGHTANATDARTGKPTCAICIGLKEGAETVTEAPDLTGRRARCLYYRSCSNEVDSDIELAFFGHNKDGEHDDYYCGCEGWD